MTALTWTCPKCGSLHRWREDYEPEVGATYMLLCTVKGCRFKCAMRWDGAAFEYMGKCIQWT